MNTKQALELIYEDSVEKFGKEAFENALNKKERELQLAELLSERRQHLELKQAELAKKLHTTQQQYSKIEKAITMPKLDVLLTIFDVLGLEMVIKEKGTHKELLHI